MLEFRYEVHNREDLGCVFVYCTIVTPKPDFYSGFAHHNYQTKGGVANIPAMMIAAKISAFEYKVLKEEEAKQAKNEL